MRIIHKLAALCFLLLSCCSPNIPVTGVAKSSKRYCIKGACYTPQKHYNYAEEGLASWYGPNFHGKKTAAGHIYNQHYHTAAHRTLPLPTIAKVTNLDTNASVIVLVDDRGPFNSTIHTGCKRTYRKRIVDLSYAAMKKIGGLRRGVIPVRIETFPEESQEFAEVLATLQRQYKGKKIHFAKAFYKMYA